MDFNDFIPILEREFKKSYPECSFEFSVNKGNKYLYEIIYYWLSGHPNFEKLGLNLKKGLLIQGTRGTGKTIAMRAYKCVVYKLHLVEATKIVTDYNAMEWAVFEKYNRPTEYYYHDEKKKILCIDDLGMENTKIKLWGNEENVLEKVLYDRYNLFQMFNEPTWLITNLKTETLNELYKERATDRMKEMFNIVKIVGESLRR